MKVYNKLIRDKIPEIMEEKGKSFKTHIASMEEYEQKLKEKLLEEVNEFLEEPCLEEMADIAEVFGALLAISGYSIEELESKMHEKSEARGSFLKRVVLETVGE